MEFYIVEVPLRQTAFRTRSPMKLLLDVLDRQVCRRCCGDVETQAGIIQYKVHKIQRGNIIKIFITKEHKNVESSRSQIRQSRI